ncbi:PUSL1 protein, partial [Amia calva]|nr:PUSL1 protein [Amia calva]
DAIRRLRPVNEVCVSVSSRTDAGVHALCNSAHLDLQRRGDLPPFPEEVLTDAINYHLKPEPIRVIKACRVPEDFHARYQATGRTYLYRLMTGVSHHAQLPVFESRLCWPLRHADLDIEAMQAAGMVLLGQHDFSTFRALNSDTPFKSPVKTLLRAEVTVGQDSFTPHSFRRGMRCWELTFQSRSFLYKQVRRMTGAMVAVGLGRLTLSRLQELLEARDSLAFPQNMSAPPDGLFLKRVDYEDS